MKVLGRVMAIILGLVHSYVAGVAFDLSSMGMLDELKWEVGGA